MSNNNRQQQEIKEDGPEYRSVMMAAPLSAPPMPRSLAPPPPRKFAGVQSAPATVQKTHITSSTSSTSSKWAPVPTAIPVYHFLERTHVYVSNCTAQTIADRITECCREHSISAIHNKDEEEDCSVLRCETDDCIKFAVRLFTAHENQLVVEVQRTCGCSFSFREVSRTVLRAAKNDTSSPVKKRSFKIPASLPVRSAEESQACVQDEFEHALAMMQSERLDAQVMGLESIEFMTRSCDSKDVLAKSILKQECLDRLFSLLETATEEEDCDTSRKVMSIIANALATLGPTYPAELLLSNNSLKAESFLTRLLSSLREAAEKPHDACQAVRCLQALLISSEIKEAIVEMRLMEVLESACSAGCNSHMALEQESQKLMAQLRSC